MKRRSAYARRFIPLACALALVAASGVARAQSGVAERGKYIFDSAGCYGCHTEPGGAPMAGGSALRTAYGTFYAPNITPDPEFGIGQWSEADFVRALREGVSPLGENYFPVFPYPAYTKMTTQDILDLRAYLKTLAPSRKPRRAHELRFPYSVRLVLTPWKWVNFQPGEFRPALDYDAQWNRGAYIVQALTHCGECHTPRNKLDGLDPRQWLSGARMPVGDLVASNLTPDKTGLDALVTRMRGEAKIFDRIGMKSVGYFAAAEAPKSENTFIYILSHENRERAKENWSTFGADPEWKELRSKSAPTGQLKIESVFVTPTDFSPVK